jgi:RecA/RadA recombinase
VEILTVEPRSDEISIVLVTMLEAIIEQILAVDCVVVDPVMMEVCRLLVVNEEAEIDDNLMEDAVRVENITLIVVVESVLVDAVTELARILEANTVATLKLKVVVNVEGLVMTMEEV